VAEIYRFAAAGGTVVAIDTATELPLTTFGLPMRDVARGHPDERFFIPGTLLRVQVDPRTRSATGCRPRWRASSSEVRRSRSAGAAARAECSSGVPVRPLTASVVVGAVREDGPAHERVDARRRRHRRTAGGGRRRRSARAVSCCSASGCSTGRQPHGTFKLLFNSLWLGQLSRTASRAGRSTVAPGLA
jgi:hypothetical protein